MRRRDARWRGGVRPPPLHRSRLAQEPRNAERGDDSDDRIVRKAPLADGVDTRELRPEEVAAEGNADERDDHAGESGLDSPDERRTEDRNERKEPEQRDRDARERRVARVLHLLAAARRADRRGVRVVDDRQICGDGRSGNCSDGDRTPEGHCNAAASCDSNVAASSPVTGSGCGSPGGRLRTNVGVPGTRSTLAWTAAFLNWAET